MQPQLQDGWIERGELTTTEHSGSVRREAEAILSQVTANPADAATRAAQLVTRANELGDVAAELIALRALSLGLLYGGDLPAALDAATTALDIAERAGATAAIGAALLTLAALQAEHGALPDALTSVRRAEQLVAPEHRAEAAFYRATIHGLLGDSADALAAFADALAACRSLGDRPMEVKVLHNRGTHHVEAGDYASARLDLEAALEVGSELGLVAGTTRTRFNLATLAAYEGNLPDALRRAEELEAAADADPLGLLDLVEGLLAARLFVEARRLAARAADRLDAEGRTHAADARLRLAVAALAADDWAAAFADAERARVAFDLQGRIGESAEAEVVATEASVRTGTIDAVDAAAELLRLANVLERMDRPSPAFSARFSAARGFLEAGLIDRAAAALAPTQTADGPRTAVGRIRRRYGSALSALVGGQTNLAARQLTAGLDELDRYRATLGAVELQASITELGGTLAALGFDLALASRRARRVFGWTERTRAASLRIVGTETPEDPELRRYLGRLRSLPVGAADQDRVRLERRIVARSRVLSSAVQQVHRPADAATVAAALGDRAMLSYTRHGDRVVTIVVVAGRVSFGPGARWDEIVGHLRTARFALDRLARPARSIRLTEATAASFAAAISELQRLLVDPIVARLGDRPLVIVPGGELTGLPWAALPALADRPFVVAPSATSFLRAEQLEARPFAAGTVAVAGPGLASAHREVSRVLDRYRAAGVPVSEAHGVDDVIGALPRSTVLHIAAHGELRTDNPLLSALLLDDGPLTVYDLHQAGSVPRTVVLSACDAGLSAVRSGDELLGLTASLLQLGARSIVAACSPVPDDLSVSFMDAFHGSLVAGAGPAESLRAARFSLRGEAFAAAIASAYACHGGF